VQTYLIEVALLAPLLGRRHQRAKYAGPPVFRSDVHRGDVTEPFGQQQRRADAVDAPQQAGDPTAVLGEKDRLERRRELGMV
jgi:hypothetical protein